MSSSLGSRNCGGHKVCLHVAIESLLFGWTRFLRLFGLSLASAQDAAECGAIEAILVDSLASAAAVNAAVNCTGGGDVHVTWAGAFTLNNEIVVGAGTYLNVTGENYDAEVRAESQTRMFNVSEGGSLFLKRLKLLGGSADVGGAIHSSSADVILDNCTFEGNTAPDGDGGAIWAGGGNVTITDCQFVRNNASFQGGAICTTGAVLTVLNGSHFEGNEAEEGGAVYCGGNEEQNETTTCSFADSMFLSNNASLKTDYELDSFSDDPSSAGDSGGATAFAFAEVSIVDCQFKGNIAQTAGGAIFGGDETDVKIEGCTFDNNTTNGYGGAIVSSSLVLGGGTNLSSNSAEENGGAIYLWDRSANTTVNEILCQDNVATGYGGCLYATGGAVVNSGAVMIGNVGERGGCIYCNQYCELEVHGGDFTCNATQSGGFAYARSGSRILITGGSATKNIATRRGGAVYCSGDTDDEVGGSHVTIQGGNFTGNEALEMGGVLLGRGTDTIITVTGGVFVNNGATYYGGFAYFQEEATFTCDGANITGNFAGEQGGGIYAIEATWINSSCILIDNQAPQGAAVYLTHVHQLVTFVDHQITDNTAYGSDVFYVAMSDVEATRVNFEVTTTLLEDATSNRAIHLDSGSSLSGESCVFQGWLGDSVVYNENADNASLVLDKCDFRDSSATMAVISTDSDAVIRNALFGDLTFENANSVDGVPTLVDRALDCSHPDACGDGQCVDSSLGVLCECLKDGTCLDDGGVLSLLLQTSPPAETYSPDSVHFELLVSAGAEGSTGTIWELNFEADQLELVVVPASGVLSPGDNVTIAVTGSPLTDDVGGDLISTFSLSSISSRTSDTEVVELSVQSTFYLCEAFEYAAPGEGSSDDILCEQCAEIVETDGVDCDEPGATLASLPIVAGYWRSDNESLTVHSCINSDACAGATAITSSDDYCAQGYEGPYCALCSEGFGRGTSNSCHSCDGAAADVLIALGALFSLVLLLLLILAAVVLIRGLAWVTLGGGTVARRLSLPHKEMTRNDEHFRGDAVHAVQRAAVQRAAAERLREPTITSSTAVYGEEARCDRGNRDVNPVLSQPKRRGGHNLEGVSAARSGVTTSQVEAKFRREQTPASTLTPVQSTRDATASAWRRQSRWGFPPGRSGTWHGSEDGNDFDERREQADNERKALARPGYRGFGERLKRWWARMPLDKLKILVVVWQILTVFPSITAVDYPPVYSRFLSWISVVNLNLGQVLSATCVYPALSFYEKLLIVTLGPITLVAALVLTYHLAKRRAGIGSAGVVAKQAAWTRHMAAGLLLSFLVFTPASTALFETFGCDTLAIEGESFLRADYSISCGTHTHALFKIYSGVMFLVYPIGIPALYGCILWRNRHLLNPTVHIENAKKQRPEEEKSEEGRTCAQGGGGDAAHEDARGVGEKHLSLQEQEELQKLVKMRRTNPELMPSMFLWKDFGPDLYYYEVLECGRRILLTGVLIFIDPGSAAQASMACIFAFASVLGFELLRPHLDPMDWWLYRLGCVVIFLSNFLALLIKVDAAGESNRDTLGCLLVAVNVLLALAVIATSWFSTQQQIDDSIDDEDSYTLAMDVFAAERLAAQDLPGFSSRTARPLSGFSKVVPSVRRSPGYVAPSIPANSESETYRDTFPDEERRRHVRPTKVEDSRQRVTS